MKQYALLSAITSLLLLLPHANADDALDAKVVAILGTNCGSCHRDSDEGGMNYITNLSKLIERKKVTPGDATASRILARITDSSDPMPPAGESPRPTEADIQTIRQWIESLSKSPEPTEPKPTVPAVTVEEPERTPVSTVDVVTAIHTYLSPMDEADRRFQRFFVLNHLHNMPSRKADKERGFDREQLDTVRAAVSKTLNSLTWSPTIVVPKIIDANKTVMAFDIRDVQWNENRRLSQPDLWGILLQEYPYALTHDQYPDVRPTNASHARFMTGPESIFHGFAPIGLSQRQRNRTFITPWFMTRSSPKSAIVKLAKSNTLTVRLAPNNR